MLKQDVVIIGASASGLMCAIEAAKRGRRVTVLDHANKPGKKILMSGGGKCNFTNYDVSAENYLSENPHFCKSALSRFTQWDFLEMIHRHQITFHERSHGQLFCNDSAKDILNMLLKECEENNVTIRLNCKIEKVNKKADHHYILKTSLNDFHASSLVIASGGLSIPKMCASPFGYQIAEQFSLNIIPTRAGLVPFTLQPDDKKLLSPLSGIAVDSVVENKRNSFRENMLFTHRGLSGPVILQISSYWKSGESVECNLLPDCHLEEYILNEKSENPRQQVNTIFNKLLPKRLVSSLLPPEISELQLKQLNHEQVNELLARIHKWEIKPNGTEGYRTAEVTLGGVDCNEISSKTLECRNVPGLYFIGEVLDVTGWLGGYNFQWAWSSGWCAGQYV